MSKKDITNEMSNEPGTPIVGVLPKQEAQPEKEWKPTLDPVITAEQVKEIIKIANLVFSKLDRIDDSLYTIAMANTVKANQAKKEIATTIWSKGKNGYTNGNSTLPLNTPKDVLLDNGIPEELIEEQIGGNE